VFVSLEDAGAILATPARTFVGDRSQNGGLGADWEFGFDESHYGDPRLLNQM
jgi:hypothetical protein